MIKYFWLALFCAAPLWAATSAADLRADIETIHKKTQEIRAYRQIYALSAEFFADEASPADLKIELAETIILPALEAILRYFTITKKQVTTPEFKKMVDMNTAVVEKLKNSYILYVRGLKKGDESLKTRANIMAAVEAPALSVQLEEYAAQLKKDFDLD